MRIEIVTLITILGMALATYATRASGVWMLSRFQPSPRFNAWLRHVPGAILVAIITPLVLNGGLPSAAAAFATALIAARTNNLLLAIGGGVGLVWLLRTLS
ncbi:MAG TPA: AzlD domain-containing protein [Gammaproteobacteria bacterium]|nr:AzlD domain-containing protein [Gammaproteobacteria bacterium]